MAVVHDHPLSPDHEDGLALLQQLANGDLDEIDPPDLSLAELEGRFHRDFLIGCGAPTHMGASFLGFSVVEWDRRVTEQHLHPNLRARLSTDPVIRHRWLLERRSLTDGQGAHVDFYLSLYGPYAAWGTRQRPYSPPGAHWREIVAEVERRIVSAGYELVPSDILRQPVPFEIDTLLSMPPFVVFDALFHATD